MTTEAPQPPSGDESNSLNNKIIISSGGMDFYKPSKVGKLSKFYYAGGQHLPRSHSTQVFLRELREKSRNRGENPPSHPQ